LKQFQNVDPAKTEKSCLKRTGLDLGIMGRTKKGAKLV